MDDLIGKICPFCLNSIQEGDSVIVCPECGVAHHENCWYTNGGCTTPGCSHNPKAVGDTFVEVGYAPETKPLPSLTKNNDKKTTASLTKPDQQKNVASLTKKNQPAQQRPAPASLTKPAPQNDNKPRTVASLTKTAPQNRPQQQPAPKQNERTQPRTPAPIPNLKKQSAPEAAPNQPAGDTQIVCVKCGRLLAPNQRYCPACGTEKKDRTKPVEVKTIKCKKCGTQVPADKLFCTNCGQRINDPPQSQIKLNYGTELDLKPKDEPAPKPEPEQKKKSSFKYIAIGVAAVLAIIIFFSNAKVKDFNKLYQKEYGSKAWCTITTDGSKMVIDTNPGDQPDTMVSEAYDKIITINSQLGFTGDVFRAMQTTRFVDGVMNAENDKYKVSWRYHPDIGLEATYTIKGKSK